MTVQPQYIIDKDGNKISVIISIEEYNAFIELLEDMDDVRIYDEAKKEDDGTRIPLDEVFKRIEAKRKNKN